MKTRSQLLLLIIIFAFAFFPSLAQKPSFTFGKQRENSTITNENIILGDFQLLFIKNKNSIFSKRMLRINIGDLNSFNKSKFLNALLGDEKIKLSSIDAIRIIKNHSDASGRGYVAVSDEYTSPIIDEVDAILEGLADDVIVEFELNYSAIEFTSLPWLGISEDFHTNISELYVKHPEFSSINLKDSNKELEAVKVSKSKDKYDLSWMIQKYQPIEYVDLNWRINEFIPSWKKVDFKSRKILADISIDFRNDQIAKLRQEVEKSFEGIERIERKHFENPFADSPFLNDNKDASAIIYYDRAVNNLSDAEYSRKIKMYINTTDGLQYGSFQTPSFVSFRGVGDKKITISVFNLEGENVTKSVLDEESIFKVDISNNFYTYRISSPNVKVGSIIVVDYVIKDFTLQNWYFQWDIPVMESEFKIVMPFDASLEKKVIGQLPVSYTQGKSDITNSGGVAQYEHRFVARNIPALKSEPLITSLNNYKAGLEYNYASPNYEFIFSDWNKVGEVLYSISEFGGYIKIDKDLLPVVEKINTVADDKKISEAYKYVTENFSWNEKGGLVASEGRNKFLKEKSGNVAAINLTLVSILKAAGFSAQPILTRMRGSGFMGIASPRIAEIDYVLCGIGTDDGLLILDATDSTRPMDVLPERALNSFGIRLAEDAYDVVEIPTSEASKRLSYINLFLNDNGIISGTIQQSFDGYANYEIREEIDSSSIDDYKEKLQSSFLLYDIDDFELSIDDDVNKSVKSKFKITSLDEARDELIFKPILIPFLLSNPLSSIDRNLPISLTTKEDYSLIVNLDYGDMWSIKSLPKSEIFYLIDDGSNGEIRLLFNEVGNKIQMTLKIKLNKNLFLPNEYSLIKGFYDKIIQTNDNVIILKRNQ